ncbi:MAG TPA: lysophospholipid acyltransferase family protein [Gemmatimonadota bacterium]|jgi:1-acyl-sn-glycerol-3-phosphate acyltransferase|nr:lysophospholipid acyltransferase family protein [Gemmatimonadota bacterium]
MLRTAYAWVVGVAFTVFWASLGILTWPLSPRGDLYLLYARIWSGWILGSLGIPLAVTGRERLEPGQTYVLMSNHQSVFDIFALFRSCDRPFRMVAKRILFWIPILGWSMWMCGFIPIDRSNRDSAIRSLDRAARKIRSGVSVLVFPEGTRSRDGTLQPFKKGGFMMALEAGVPVVPVVVLGTDAIMEKGSLRVGRADVTVRIGTPIETSGRGARGRDRLMDEVRRAMIDLGATACENAAA